jgi:aldehyde:ferredoxin oxidoreductase
MKGYKGRILLIDLGNGSIEEEIIDDLIYRQYLSGIGLGVYILNREIKPGADPLGPDNVLGFVSGLLTGTGSLVTGRWMALCKSPLTGGWGDANCGGNFSPAIKQCGYDGIFFKGISSKPVYLIVDESGARLEDAVSIWGLDAVETENLLGEKHRDKTKPAIAVIGQSAEKLSLISGICNDRGRIAARSGCGAVMGSKRLKAVVLKGYLPIEVDNRQLVRSLSKGFRGKIRKSSLPKFINGKMLPILGMIMGKLKIVTALDGMLTLAATLKKWGTIMSNSLGITSGDLPVKNWRGSVIDYNRSHYKYLNPDLLIKREHKKYSCYSCVIGCGGICAIEDLKDGIFRETHKPEYETCAAFGALIMNKDLDSIFYINELLNRAGMDSISAGNTVAYAMECYENGLITLEDTGGIELTWGNSGAVIELLKKMISREGIGDILADGVKRAVEIIGPESAKYAMHAGGQEPGMHDPRFDPMLGLHFSADPTPGRHTIGCGQYYQMMHLWEEVSWAPRITRHPKAEEYVASDKEAQKAVALACFKQVIDGSGGCLFAALTGINNWPLFQWLNAATGWEYDADEYMEIGKRIQTLRQLFNIREGIEPMSFKIPDRITGIPPMTEGPLKGKSVPIEEMIRLYWKHFGWDENSGIPKRETLERLGLETNILPSEPGKSAPVIA